MTGILRSRKPWVLVRAMLKAAAVNIDHDGALGGVGRRGNAQRNVIWARLAGILIKGAIQRLGRRVGAGDGAIAHRVEVVQAIAAHAGDPAGGGGDGNGNLGARHVSQITASK